MRERIGIVGVLGLGGALFGLLNACNSLDEAKPETGSRTIVPVDDRPVQQALTKLPAISGGTLAISQDSRFAVAADPDRDRVSIVDLQTSDVKQIAFAAGDEPGRVITSASGQAFVALRRAGDVVAIDIATAQIQKRTHVCAAARGLALDAQDLLHVACADGRLTTLHAANGELVRELKLDHELRDVMVRGDHLLVSTFKSAELLSVDATGVVDASAKANDFQVDVLKTVKTEVDGQESINSMVVPQPMQSHVAWRTAQNAAGQVFMLHQGASEDVVDISKKDQDQGQSPYGGGGSQCGGIVTAAVSMLDAHGQFVTMPVAMGPVTVDMAISGTGLIALVQAGTADMQAPRPTTVQEGDAFPTASPGFGPGPLFAPQPMSGGFGSAIGEPLPGTTIEQTGSSQVMVISPTQFAQAAPGTPTGSSTCQFGSPSIVAGQATAVAFAPNGEMVVQSREPGMLTKFTVDGLLSPRSQSYDLGGASVRDSGHEIFHRDAGGGIACASCHAEGAEDGHTWKFTGIGERRTQALHVGLEGTAPFHWNGDERDIGHLMEDVFVGRMGGVHQSSARLDALTDWLFALRPPAPMGDAGSDAAIRGKALFESAATGCTSCHTGAKFTNSKNADVGTGGSFQVPSLLGVGYRAPLMHTGCAATLADRFDPSCGGAQHGNTANMKPVQIDDMVAYLRTL